jgi:hypothetical protein
MNRTVSATLAVLSTVTLSAALSVSLPAAAQAATYYVSPSGQDANAGTLTSPWKTMRKGLTSLKAGDTLYVRGGVYIENLGGSSPIAIRQGSAVAPITVAAYPSERPVLQGLLWLSRPSYWTLDGINVTWQSGNASTQHMIRLTNGVGWTFKNAEVWGARSFAAFLVASTITGEPSGWTVAHNAIHDTYPSNQLDQDHLIYANTGLSAGTGLIERNLLYNARNGMGVKVGGADSTQGSVNVTVRYNTIYNTSQCILVGWRSSKNRIYRNILSLTWTSNSGVRGYQLTGAGNVAYENAGSYAKSLFMNDAGYQPVADGGGNCFPLDPQFDYPGLSGFHPQNPLCQNYGVYAP